ncbi:MAG: glycoside hydrolase family 3 protein [Candidatus Latescibacterota bacterium]
MIDERWVEQTLARMSIEEKVGQTLMPRIEGNFLSGDSERFREYAGWIERFHVGGLELFFTDVYSAAYLLNRLQTLSKLPLLVGSDAETGMAHRVAGATHLTHNMGLGATGDEQMAYLQGKITALEGAAIGVRLFEGPTVDVNVNPDNPIIAVRSFGDDPEFVSRMGAAFVRGVQDHGMIACPKHFPGHGNTSVDSHMDMPVIGVPRETLDRVDLPPFRAAFDAGAMSVMTAHIRVPSLDPGTEYPATLSRAVNTGLLRGEMGFQGLIITDCMRMDGITKYFPPGEAELQSFLAGSDIILGPFLEEAYTTMVKAVGDGRLSPKRLDESVRRILWAKTWCDLHENRLTDPGELHYRVGTERILADARALTDASITLLRNDGGLLPIRSDRAPRILSIVYYDHPLGDVADTFQEEMRRRATGAFRQYYQEGIVDESGNIQTITIPCDSDPRREADAIARANGCDLVVCALVYRIIMRRNTPNLRPRAADFMRRLCGTGTPVAAVSFGAPYVLKQIPEAEAFVASYMYSPLVQQATVRALFGEIPFWGKAPVHME